MLSYHKFTNFTQKVSKTVRIISLNLFFFFTKVAEFNSKSIATNVVLSNEAVLRQLFEKFFLNNQKLQFISSNQSKLYSTYTDCIRQAGIVRQINQPFLFYTSKGWCKPVAGSWQTILPKLFFSGKKDFQLKYYFF